MAKNKISEWSAVAANNTDVGGIDIAEGCAPSGINNAIREMMAQIKDQQAGTDADNFTVGGNLVVVGTATGVTPDPSDNSTKLATTAFVQTKVGTLGTMASQNANAVAITGGSITGITDLAVADGGTGSSTLSANAVLLGNGTSALQTVAPSTSGNVLTSNGTTWTSATPAGGIGIGQTWQEVTRTIGTTYTNDTGKPIMLVGQANRNGVSTAGLSITIGGVTIPLCYNTNSNGGNTAVGSTIIPTGATYVLSVSSEPLSSYKIYELR